MYGRGAICQSPVLSLLDTSICFLKLLQIAPLGTKYLRPLPERGTAISFPSKARQGTIHAAGESNDKQAARGTGQLLFAISP